MSPQVIVAMPAYTPLDPETVASLLGICSRCSQVVNFTVTRFMYIDEARNGLVRNILYGKQLPNVLGKDYNPLDVTHIMFLDNDMIWPKDMISELLEHKKPIVSGLYFLKDPPHDCIAFNFDDRRVDIRLKELPEGLAQVDGAGMGCCLIETHVFRELAKTLPKRELNDSQNPKWFSSESCGEDVYFFRRCKSQNIPVFVDGRIICGHIGREVVTDEHFRAYRSLEIQ